MTRSLLAYICLAYAVSWSLMLLMKLMGMAESQETMAIAVMIFMLGPAISVGICSAIWPGEKRSFGLRPKANKAMLAAWGLPILASILAVLITAGLSGYNMMWPHQGIAAENLAELGDGAPDIPPAFTYAVLSMTLTFGVLLNTVFSIFEEIGWRGYMHEETIKLGFWPSSLFTGFVWGLWHTPLISLGWNYLEEPGLAILLMTILCMAMSPLMTVIRLWSKSIWGPCLFHGCFNAVGGVSIVSVTVDNDIWRGVFGLGGILAFAILSITAYLLAYKNSWITAV